MLNGRKTGTKVRRGQVGIKAMNKPTTEQLNFQCYP